MGHLDDHIIIVNSVCCSHTLVGGPTSKSPASDANPFFRLDYISSIGDILLTLSILLYEPYANESSQICPFSAARTQFDSDHHQNRRLSSHSYSHESVIFLYFLY